MNKTVLITGGTGYLGANLVQRLLSDGYNVGVLVREGGSFRLLNQDLKRLQLLKFDGQYNSIDDWFAVHKPLAVFHLASLFLVKHDAVQISELIACNIQLGTLLAEACVRHDCNIFVNTGTSWQSYSSDSYDPTNLYAATKESFENILTYFSRCNGLKVVTLRLFDTYGPNDPRKKIIQLLLNCARTGDELNLSPGEQRLNLVYITDVVECYISTLHWISRQEEKTNKYFGVYSDVDYSLKEIVSIIEKLNGRKLRVNFGFYPYRELEVMQPAVGYQRLPGWSPTVSFESGFSELLRSD